MATESRLLNLPGELRNRVYDHIFADIDILRINKSGFLVPPPITSVCRQLRQEVQNSGYLGYSLATRPRVQQLEAHVVDFDFRHVIKFFTRVAECGLARVEKLEVDLRLTGAQVDQSLVLRWIDYMVAGYDSPDTYAIDIGNQTWSSLQVSYSVEMSHQAGRYCACSGVLAALRELQSSEGLESHWKDINDRLWSEVCRSHQQFERNRAEDEFARLMRRYVQSYERVKGLGMEFWLDKIGRAQPVNHYASLLSSMVNQSSVVEAFLGEFAGASPLRTVGKALTIRTANCRAARQGRRRR